MNTTATPVTADTCCPVTVSIEINPDHPDTYVWFTHTRHCPRQGGRTMMLEQEAIPVRHLAALAAIRADLTGWYTA